MKGYVKESILYIFDHVPQDLSSVPDWEMPADIDKIYIQTEYVDGFKELNPDYADIMFGKNFCIMQYNPKPEEEHFEDDVNGHEIAITGDSSVHFTPSAWQALQNEVIIITPEDQTFGPGAIELSSKQATLVWNNTFKYWEFTMPDADVTIKCKDISGGGTDWAVTYDDVTGAYNITIGDTDTRAEAFGENDGNISNVVVNTYLYKLSVDSSVVSDFVETVDETSDHAYIWKNLHSEAVGLDLNFYFSYAESIWYEGNPSDDSSILTFSGSEIGETYTFAQKTQAPISWSSDSATVTIGADDNIFPTLSNEEELSPIIYESWDESVATINEYGEITLVGPGEATIVATYQGDVTDYYETSVSYQLTVLSNEHDYSQDYLTFEVPAESTPSFTWDSSSANNQLQYSLNYAEWEDYDSSAIGPLGEGDTIRWRLKEDASIVVGENGMGKFGADASYIAKGNVMSIVFGDNFASADDLSGYGNVLANLFKNTPIVDAENLVLPATTLDNACYAGMFKDCRQLTKAPKELPAMTVPEHAYEFMFEGCTHLTTVPNLPATNLGESCYRRMFRECSDLTAGPEILPATTLAVHCYNGMFMYDASLTSAPFLPALSIFEGSYYDLFNGCTSLDYIKCYTTDISASYGTVNWVDGVAAQGTFEVNPYYDVSTAWTTGVDGIPSGWQTVNHAEDYFALVPSYDTTTFSFSGSGLEYSLDCSTWTQLDAGDSTPSVEYGQKIYFKGSNMTPDYNTGIGTFSADNYFSAEGNIMSLLFGDNFFGEYDLTGYTNAFKKLFATSMIEDASKLIMPASTLAVDCYNDMFNGSGIVHAPKIIPASAMAGWCCKGMFYDCAYLEDSPELPATTLAEECYFAMFEGCQSLTKAPELPATTLATQCYKYMFENCYNLNYIKCGATDITATNCTEDWVKGVAEAGTFVKDINMQSWQSGISGIPADWLVEDYGEHDYSNDYLTFEALEPTTFKFSRNNLQYSVDDGSTWTTLTADTSTSTINTGEKILWKQTGLIPAPNNGIGKFSATGNFKAYGNIMSLYYGDNFIGQKSLISTDYYSFYGLFYQNLKLTDASNLILPATTLVNYCYNQMFMNCVNLTSAPALPATNLSEGCYYSMFKSCGFSIAPILPATTLVDYCYKEMFYYCSSLNYIKCLATDISATNCTNNWVKNTGSTGTFVKDASMTSWTTGTSGIPSGWTSEDAS